MVLQVQQVVSEKSGQVGVRHSETTEPTSRRWRRRLFLQHQMSYCEKCNEWPRETDRGRASSLSPRVLLWSKWPFCNCTSASKIKRQPIEASIFTTGGEVCGRTLRSRGRQTDTAPERRMKGIEYQRWKKNLEDVIQQWWWKWKKA